jgi:hypothetical protein
MAGAAVDPYRLIEGSTAQTRETTLRMGDGIRAARK